MAGINSSSTVVGANSQLVKKYAAEFKNMSGQDIGKKLYEQIDGWSDNEKTLSMFDAIPDDKLYDAVSAYNNKNRVALFSFNYAKSDYVTVEYPNLFDALNSESGIGAKELKPRISRYIEIKYKNGNINKNTYAKLKELINSGENGKDYNTQTIYEIEHELGSHEYYQATSIFGNKYFARRNEIAW